MNRISLLLGLAMAVAACGSADGEGPSYASGQGVSSNGKSDAPAGNAGAAGHGTGEKAIGAPNTSPSAGSEVCGDGLDNNGDGNVDERCTCTIGTTQKCFAGDAAKAGNGVCKFGTQSCVKAAGTNEFQGSKWDVCKGSGTPSVEACDGVDNDCNGTVDDNCDCKNGDTQDCSTACGSGKQSCTGGKWSDCNAPQPDANGTCACQAGDTQDCSTACGQGKQSCAGGKWTDCDALQPDANGNCFVQMNINVDGDCVCAPACPSNAPYPVGCQIDFQGGNSNGCVALAGNGALYFQEGVKCDAGHLTGFVICSSLPGDPLNATNCPINKSDPHYGKKPSDCPEITGGDPQSCYH
jgi:hypothetical protein